MYSPSKDCLSEFKKIVIYDLMKIRTFSHIHLDFIIDIGANIGVATIFSKTMFPLTKVIAIEPDQDNFACLEKNTSFISGVYRENKAIGNNKKYNIFSPKNKSQRHRFIDKYTKPNNSGNINGISLKNIFDKYNVTGTKYFIKSDCESAEQYFINDLYFEQAVKNSEVFFMEIHFYSKHNSIFKTTWKEYNDWIYDNFSNTHTIEYYKSNKLTGRGHYLLRRQ